MERFGRILGRLISMAGLLLILFVLIYEYRGFSNPPCQIDMNRRSTTYVCEDLRSNSGIEINGINQLFDPYTDSEIIQKSNNNPHQVKQAVQSLINQGLLKERVNWEMLQESMIALAIGLLIFIFGSKIGEFAAIMLRKLLS